MSLNIQCSFQNVQSLGTKRTYHPPPTIQNNEPIPQVLKQVINQSCLNCNMLFVPLNSGYIIQFNMVLSSLYLLKKMQLIFYYKMSKLFSSKNWLPFVSLFLIYSNYFCSFLKRQMLKAPHLKSSALHLSVL